MPRALYWSFFGTCTLDSREYAVLKDAGSDTDRSQELEIACEATDVALLLDRSQQLFPEAARYFQACVVNTPTAKRIGREYRRPTESNVWHFCSNCARWPIEGDYVTSAHMPTDHDVCIECTAKNWLNRCTS
jgi:hypothetical protein